MTSRERGTKLSKADATEQKILEASLARIAQYGESGLSMTEISKDLGVSRPTVYRYFPTREALMAAVFEYVIKDYSEKLQQQIDDNDDPLKLVDVIADFSEARLFEGGADLFQLDPQLILKLFMGSQKQLMSDCERAFSPLFDLSESLLGKQVDRKTAAMVFLLFNSALAFFTKHSPPENIGDILRKVIRAISQME